MFTTIAAKDQEKWRAIALTSVYIQQKTVPIQKSVVSKSRKI